jgi:hypothetical protein
MNTILSILALIVTGLFAFITFILANCKKEIYESIIFGDEYVNL